ncbi:MAG TPA: hybrid sensor histidine kinase/response regulator [Cellvibrionaceae bacterium]
MLIQSVAKILIVDDLPENLQALAKVIEANDREIYQAMSGDTALELLLEHEFALAILDVMMPGMNGFQLAELMRSTERTRHIPIIFVSAGGKELNYAFKGYETGAVDFLHKPLDISAVKSKVNVFVSLYQKTSQVKHQVVALERSQRELNHTQLELQKALKMRDDFMSMVAHELRTPLNTLYLEAQVRGLKLSQGDTSAFTLEKLSSMIERDGRQIQNMARLISDMVDVTQIQNGKLSIRPSHTDLSELLHRIVAYFSPQAEIAGSSVVLTIEENVTGVWDEFRVEQIIINLLTNALRYGEGKPIEVILVKTCESAEISVRDRGVGIAPTEQQRIFEKFERGGNQSVREGLGIGLYIARHLAAVHNGTLMVKSTLGEGATFTLKLPNV